MIHTRREGKSRRPLKPASGTCMTLYSNPGGPERKKEKTAGPPWPGPARRPDTGVPCGEKEKRKGGGKNMVGPEQRWANHPPLNTFLRRPKDSERGGEEKEKPGRTGSTRRPYEILANQADIHPGRGGERKGRRGKKEKGASALDP